MVKVLELFAGIGAFSKALDKLSIQHEIVDAVEIDKFSITSFNEVHGTNFEPQDITKWDKDFPNIDVMLHGSPCQDFSFAGKQAGGDEGSGTRSSLMYESLRIISTLRPKYVIWENVKAVLSKKHIHNFQNYLNHMVGFGYENYYQVLNAKDYGVPQNRERVFTVSIRNDLAQDFTFPEKQPLTTRLKDILEKEVDESFYLSDEQVKKIKMSTFNHREPKIIDDTYANRDARVYDEYSPALRSERSGLKVIEPKFDGTTNTLTSVQKDNYIVEPPFRVRKLTPKEYWRLMGFDDDDYEKSS